MADADVPITAGTGTKIDTRTVGAGTDEHRQVVVIGDPATAANVASADAANGLDVDVTRLPALPAGTNNIGDVDVLTLPSVVQGNAGSDAQGWYVRGRRVATYGAGYRLAVAASGLQLAFTFTANTDKQLATIYHAAAATKAVRVRYASLSLQSGAAGSYMFEMRPLSATTAPATGNPAITPSLFDFGDAAAEATCLALPTTAGSYVNADRPVSPAFHWNSGAAAATTNPSGMGGQEFVLHNSRDGIDRKPLTMPATTACGFAIVGRCTAAVALGFTCYIEFTED